MDTQIAYKPQSGDRLPFLRAQLDLCGAKCHRPNISVALKLEATPKFGPRSARSFDSNSNFNKRKRKRRLNSVAFNAGHEDEEGDDEVSGPSAATSSNKKVENSGAEFMSDEASGGNFHCDRESYSMISKRRLCGKLAAPIWYFLSSYL